MIKWILLIVVAILIFYYINKKLTKTTHVWNECVECHSCGTYVVEREAIKRRGKYYCSEECLRKSS